jgi:benzoyl-CoA reductase/2-hydroxyglutaryl-CoA dehydratase subunit BcrC/BadD/HgdB
VTESLRRARQLERTRQAVLAESRTEAAGLRSREDWLPEYEYFLNLAEEGPSGLAQRTGRPVMAVLCLSAPLELLEAFGFQPLRLTGGHLTADRLASPNLPAVMCPMLRSVLGLALMNQTSEDPGRTGGWAGQILTAACGWAGKYEDLGELCGLEKSPSFLLQTPKKKNSHQSLLNFQAEVRSLERFLAQAAGKMTSLRDLKNAVRLYREVYRALSDLIEAKRDGRLRQIWFALAAGAFSLDRPARWLDGTEKLLKALPRKTASGSGPKIFLAGSPIVFPNFKILKLLEEAGLTVIIDDMCSSERILPGPVHLGDDSREGILEALAQRYHLGCLCPGFADDDRRINSLTSPEHRKLVQGAVFHVLKGCHPFDLESLVLEPRIKAGGLKFIRLETDNSQADGPGLLTRLEAFRETLLRRPEESPPGRSETA